MTLIVGNVADVGLDGLDGTLKVWAGFRPEATALIAPRPSTYDVVDGVIPPGVEVIPGPAVLDLDFGVSARTQARVMIPDQETVTIQDLFLHASIWEPWRPYFMEDVADTYRRAIEALARAENALDDADTSVAAVVAAEARVGIEHEHIHQDAAHVDAVAALVGELLEQANVFAQDQVPPYLQDAVLKATYADKAEVAAVESRMGSMASQQDYVAMCAAGSIYSKMTVTKKADGGFDVRCENSDGSRSVTHTIGSSARYQYVRQINATSAAALTTQDLLFSDLATAGTGTWVGVATAPFTRTVGDSWQYQVTTGATSPLPLVFRHSTDNRGGVWRISVVERPDITIDVTTWRATAMVVEAPLFALPSAGTWTIKGVFIGADPVNPASDGTPRGWFGNIFTGGEQWTLRIPAVAAGGGAQNELSPVSNKDFAFKMRPAGSSAGYEFVPYHGTESEVFASPTKFYAGGVALDVSAMVVGTPVEVDGFEWVQHLYGRNAGSANPTQNIAEFWTRQKISRNGTFSVTGRWKSLINLDMSQSTYPMMLVGTMPVFDEVVSSRRTSHPISPALAPSIIVLTDELDTVDSYAMLSSTTDHIAAVQIRDRAETLRAGQANKPPNEQKAFIELRTGGNMAKLYQGTYATGTVIQAGHVHRFAGQFWYGSIPGMRNALTLT